MRRSVEYVALASSSDNLNQGSEETENSRSYLLSNNSLVFWACIGALCTSILSFSVFIRGTFWTPARSSVHPPYDQPLRRPSMYINLDKILKDVNDTFPPITNFPPVVLQISTSDPRRKMTEDHRQWRSAQGTIYPDDRHILVSAETSTVVQFRNLDYMMERCVLTASLPRHTEPSDPATTLYEPSRVDVWLLDTTTEISPYIVGAWERAPKRRGLLTTLTFSKEGPSTSEEFHCPSGEFTALEFACAPSKPSCSVDFWQDQRAIPRGGVYMTQFQSTIDTVDA
ncbi:hypothetical protein AcW1_001920 [Taiwanofungus camphoratus]|nr:hypothetical protein AcW1_001920 [Antrodia cinnamomea]